MSYWETIEHENKASIKACNILCNGDKLPQKTCQKMAKTPDVLKIKNLIAV